MELEEAKKYIIMILRQKDVPDAVKSQECIYAVEAIETVLEELENKDNEIHKLKQANSEKAFRINEQYIPKSKIEDKIEELKNNEYWSADREELITELEELLEE